MTMAERLRLDAMPVTPMMQCADCLRLIAPLLMYTLERLGLCAAAMVRFANCLRLCAFPS